MFIVRFIVYVIIGWLIFKISGKGTVILFFGSSSIEPREFVGMCEASLSSCAAIAWYHYWWAISGVLALLSGDTENKNIENKDDENKAENN